MTGKGSKRVWLSLAALPPPLALALTVPALAQIERQAVVGEFEPS